MANKNANFANREVADLMLVDYSKIGRAHV